MSDRTDEAIGLLWLAHRIGVRIKFDGLGKEQGTTNPTTESYRRKYGEHETPNRA